MPGVAREHPRAAVNPDHGFVEVMAWDGEEPGGPDVMLSAFGGTGEVALEQEHLSESISELLLSFLRGELLGALVASEDQAVDCVVVKVLRPFLEFPARATGPPR